MARKKDIHFGCKCSFSNEHAYESPDDKGMLHCVHCGFTAHVLGTTVHIKPMRRKR